MSHGRGRPHEERDLALGRALDELDAPDYPPDFLTGVWARVDNEDGLAAQARPPRRSRSFRVRRPLVAGIAAAAVAAAVAAILLLGVPGVRNLSGPQPVSAAQVVRLMLHALSSGRSLQADNILRTATGVTAKGDPTYTVTHYHLTMRADGSYRVTQTDAAQAGKPLGQRDHLDANDVAFDATTGVYLDYKRGWDSEASPLPRHVDRLVVRTGYPLGPPDRWASLQMKYDAGAMARALQVAGTMDLETVTYESRPTWVITGYDRRNPPLTGGPTYSIAIDEKTSLPVRVMVLYNGVVELEYRLTNLRVDQPLAGDGFAFAPPRGTPVRRSDAGFRRLSLSEAGSFVGYAPLLPARLPRGYVLTRVAAAARSTTANGVFDERDVLAVQYRRGFDDLTVTTRRISDPQLTAAYDPVEPDSGWAGVVRDYVRLTSGPYAGVTAAVVIAPAITTPHLFAVKGDLLLTIAGAASADELVTIANSLKGHAAGGR